MKRATAAAAALLLATASFSAPAPKRAKHAKQRREPAREIPAPPPPPPLYPTGSTAPIVFELPTEGQPLAGSYDFVLGHVSDPLAHFEINGQTVTVHPKGGFIAWLPISPGTFTFHAELALSSGTAAADLRVAVAAPAPPLPASPLAVDPASLAPRADLELRAGDWWTIRMRASPGRRARARVSGGTWRDLRESAPGSYEGVFQVAPGEDFPPSPIEYQIGSGWSAQLVTGSARVSATSRAPAVAVIRSGAANPTVKIGPSDGYLAFPPPGTRFLATGREGNYVRLAFGANLAGWIDAKDVDLSTTAAPPRAVTDDIGVTTSSSDAVVRIPLGDRIPYTIEEDDGLGELTLRLYSTLGHSNWVSYDGLDDFVDEVRWRQESSDTVAVRVRLKPGRRLWGWRVRYDGATLRLLLRRPPVVDPSHPLAGLRVMLDPGHTSAPHDGTIGPLGTTEAVANFAIAQAVAARLRRDGAEPLLTRASTSDDVPLVDRPQLAVARGADVFISLHNNALPDGSNPFTKPHGFIVFYYHPQSLGLARALHESYVQKSPLADEGLKWANLLVARLSDMPAVLIENAFMIVPEQEILLSDPAFRGKLADAVAAGLRAFMLEAGERAAKAKKPK
ncbi:MAG: N-acetylmuramoyl-L-alanine amidase [Elusimicrobiota bacterium]